MVYNKGDTITTIISNQVVDPDVESLIVRFHIHCRIVRNTISFYSSFHG